MKKIAQLLLLLVSNAAIAQNDMQFSHYMCDANVFNPAVTGSSNRTIASMIMRQQWIGADNPPSTQFLNAQTYLEKVKGGIGITVINDRIGYENTLNIKFNYAYHLRLSDVSILSAGVSAGFLNKKLNGSKLIYEQDSDPSAITTNTNNFSPDFAAGLQFKTPFITVGASSTHISNSTKKSTMDITTRHYFLYAKSNIKIDNDFAIVPSVLVKHTGPINQLELSATTIYKAKASLGLSYRIKESLVGLLGFTISDTFFIGYSYDFNTKQTKSFSSGSHEIMLQVKLKALSKSSKDFLEEKY